MDSALEPVLRWKPVNAARLTVAGAAATRGRPWPRSSSNSKPGARVACASSGGGSGAAGGGGGGVCSGGGVGGAGGVLAHDGQTGSCMSSM
jgi:hypothetical protein